jgi:uncharacterized protein YjbJ (UPF0337 family)
VFASAPKKRLAVVNLAWSLSQARDRTYPLHSKGNLMNKDQVKGQVKNIAGKVQEAKGIKLQVEGKTQKGYGDAKDVAKDARHAVAHAAKSHS